MNVFKTAATVAALFILTACGNSNDYALLNPQVADDTAERLDALDSAARSAEIEALKQYEQADFDFMRGDAELDKKSNENQTF